MKNPFKSIDTYEALTGIFSLIGFITVMVGALSGTWLAWPCGIFIGIFALTYMFNERNLDEREWKHLSEIERFERTMRGKTPWNK